MYIFPKNYNFKNKIGGVIDYPTAIFNLLFIFLLYKFISIFKLTLTSKLIFISIFYTPIFLVSIFNHNDDNIICIAYYVIKFLVRPKLYLYK
jgi:hypothetical protein